MRACCIFDKDNNKIIGFYEGTPDKKTITHELMKKLPKFMIPQEFVQVASMPVTKNGKIDRNALMEGRNFRRRHPALLCDESQSVSGRQHEAGSSQV